MFKRIIGFENYSVNENGVVVNMITSHIKSPCHNNKGYLFVDLSYCAVKPLDLSMGI